MKKMIYETVVVTAPTKGKHHDNRVTLRVYSEPCMLDTSRLEYTTSLYDNGTLMCGSYYTYDRLDAMNTGNEMLAQAVK